MECVKEFFGERKINIRIKRLGNVYYDPSLVREKDTIAEKIDWDDFESFLINKGRTIYLTKQKSAKIITFKEKNKLIRDGKVNGLGTTIVVHKDFDKSQKEMIQKKQDRKLHIKTFLKKARKCFHCDKQANTISFYDCSDKEFKYDVRNFKPICTKCLPEERNGIKGWLGIECVNNSECSIITKRGFIHPINKSTGEQLVKEEMAEKFEGDYYLKYDKKSFRKKIKNREKDCCYYCGGYGETLDHKLPIVYGGLTTPSNIVLSCLDCNRKKDSLTYDEFVYNRDKELKEYLLI